MQRGGEACRGVEGHEDAEWAVPHLCVVNKNGGLPWEQGISTPDLTTQPRVPEPRRQIPIDSGYKNQRELGSWKKLQDSQKTPLKEPATDLVITQTHPRWDSAPGKQLEGYQCHLGIN